MLLLKPVPVMLLPVMETAAVPVLESVTDVGALVLPTAMLPKLMLAGLAESKGDEARIPVPETEMVRVPPF